MKGIKIIIEHDDDDVAEWIHALGWEDNPFHHGLPGSINNFFVGLEQEREKVNSFLLESLKYGTLKGPEGSGKTTFLKWLIQKLKHNPHRIVTNYVTIDRLDAMSDIIKKVTKPLLRLSERTFKKVYNQMNERSLGNFLTERLAGKKRMLLLIDDCENLAPRYYPLIKSIYDSNANVQIIIAGKEGTKNLSAIGMIDSLRIDMEEAFSMNEIKQIITKRIEYYHGKGTKPFNERSIKLLWMASDSNFRKFFGLCQENAMRFAGMFTEKTKHEDHHEHYHTIPHKIEHRNDTQIIPTRDRPAPVRKEEEKPKKKREEDLQHEETMPGFDLITEITNDIDKHKKGPLM